MFLEIGIIAAGVPVGYALRKCKPVVRLTDATMIWSIRALLLFLGLALGGNELLMSQLESLGVQGAVIALCAVLGSLLGARCLEPHLRLEQPVAPPSGSGDAARP